jgi:hypothetical protein
MQGKSQKRPITQSLLAMSLAVVNFHSELNIIAYVYRVTGSEKMNWFMIGMTLAPGKSVENEEEGPRISRVLEFSRVLERPYMHRSFRYAFLSYMSRCSPSSPSSSTTSSDPDTRSTSSSIGVGITHKEVREFQAVLNHTLELQRISEPLHVADYVNVDRTIQSAGEMKEDDIVNLVRRDLELRDLASQTSPTIHHTEAGQLHPSVPVPPPPTKAETLLAINTIERFLKSRPALTRSSNLVYDLRDLVTKFDGTAKRQQTLDDMWRSFKKA